MKLSAATKHKSFRSVAGAALAVLCGLAVWGMPVGEGFTEASYDYLFRFGSRAVTNQVVLVLMDNDAHHVLHQSREGFWSRGLHAQLLEKLAPGGCPLVIFDTFFRPGETAEDRRLAEAMRRCACVVLMAAQARTAIEGAVTARAIPPTEPFLTAARTNWGVAWLDPELGTIVRQHWPFPSPGPYPSLPWKAALLSGAALDDAPRERWLRYYGAEGAWTSLSYHLALNQPTNFFHDKVVFVGNKPKTTVRDGEVDKFCTPYIHWKGETVGGVEILATAYLNLMNGDWLRRPAWGLELLLFVLTGACLGGGLCQLRRSYAWTAAGAAVLVLTIGAVLLTHFTNYWVPWLVAAGGQVPCALGWAVLSARKEAPVEPLPEKTVVMASPDQRLPDAPEYELFQPPLGEGGFGKVWLARNAIGQWQALKAVYQSTFGDNFGPYEAEFKGLQKYKPVSENHPGLLRIELVSRMKGEGYFYYVMELGDSQTPGWENNPALYQAKDLECLRKQADGHRLPVAECLRITIILADALDYLHRQGLTHRDIKPSNIIFVNGRPKLADVGLVTDIRPPEVIQTYVGTAGYMPPPPERTGTVQADIYSLGMVLYVISTGRNPDFFPALSTTLMERSGRAEFLRVNAIILKACQPDCAQRYQSTSQMLQDLRAAQEAPA